jgi:hypothetical protein
VAAIPEEAGVPLVTLWTTYGANPEYIRKRIGEALESPPQRVRHFDAAGKQKKKQGCYIATCVYGAYDCPQVWTLRRFRDQRLAATAVGRGLIRLYYAVSPHLVAAFGGGRRFRALCRGLLDPFVAHLRRQGLDGAPYTDAEPPAPRKRRYCRAGTRTAI